MDTKLTIEVTQEVADVALEAAREVLERHIGLEAGYALTFEMATKVRDAVLKSLDDSVAGGALEEGECPCRKTGHYVKRAGAMLIGYHCNKHPQPKTVPDWAIEAFWHNFGASIKLEAEVCRLSGSDLYTSEGKMLFCTTHGDEITCPDGMKPRFVFFVDQQPNANWTHECAYVFIESKDKVAWVPASWPPEEALKMTEIK